MAAAACRRNVVVLTAAPILGLPASCARELNASSLADVRDDTFRPRGFSILILGLCLFGCDGDDNPPPVIEHAGQPCRAASECYPQLDGAALKGGPAFCITRVPDGYCTHVCSTDADCCAIPGECKTTQPQVCSPFESMGEKYCFLSCEANIVSPSGLDETAYCTTYANAAFNCRSSGGGSQNRKVCVP